MTVSVSSKTYTYTNGTANDASQVDAEFVNAFNSLSNIKTKVDNLLAGAIEDATTVTINSLFASTPSSNISIMAERGTSPNTGFRWNETNDIWEVTNDGTNYTPIFNGIDFSAINQIGSATYATAATFTIANFTVVNSATDGLIKKTTSTTVDISTTGLNGVAQSSALTGTVAVTNGSAAVTGTGTAFTTEYQVGDVIAVTGAQNRKITAIASNTSITVESNFSTTVSGAAHKNGGEAPSTWYNLYAITDGTTPGLILSTRNVVGGDTLVHLPSGYTKSKQIGFAVRNDASSNLLPWFQIGKLILWRDSLYTHSVLSSGTAAAWTAVSCTSFIPPISTLGLFQLYADNSAAAGAFTFQARKTGSSSSAGNIVITPNATPSSIFGPHALMELDSSQQFDYQITAGGRATAIVLGFIVTASL